MNYAVCQNSSSSSVPSSWWWWRRGWQWWTVDCACWEPIFDTVQSWRQSTLQCCWPTSLCICRFFYCPELSSLVLLSTVLLLPLRARTTSVFVSLLRGATMLLLTMALTSSFWHGRYKKVSVFFSSKSFPQLQSFSAGRRAECTPYSREEISAALRRAVDSGLSSVWSHLSIMVWALTKPLCLYSTCLVKSF